MTHSENHLPTQETPDSLLGDDKAFMAQLEQTAKTTKPEEMVKILQILEKHSQTPSRNVELYTDPTLDTFCCTQIPAKKVNEKGDIVEDPKKKTYLIGVPFIYAAGKAPLPFLRGEMVHERGHAQRTDFGRMERFKRLALQEGYDPQGLLSLNNCLEDARMERLEGGPLHPYERSQLFEKNQQLIIPNIANGFKNGTMSPSDQLQFLIKLEGLWAIHEKDLEGETKPWSQDNIHPRVWKEYTALTPIISPITGGWNKPAMKVNAEVEKLIVDHIWPAQKRLIDQFPDQKSQKGKKKGQDSGEGSPKEEPHYDPNNPDSWPPELQKFFKMMKQEHQKKLQKKAEKAKQAAQNKEKNLKNLEKRKNDLAKTRDGIDDPKDREKYNEIKREVTPVIQRLKRIFQKYLPKVDEPQYEWGKRGIRFSTRRYVSRILTGHENPLGRRRTPEKNTIILQIIVDGSGSMYQVRERIENATKACVAVLEASQGHNIQIEILVSDEKNVEDDPKYCIKDFNEKFFGNVKSRIVRMQTDFGGGNEDAKSIRAAVPRIKKQLQKTRPLVDRVGALSIFISDSTSIDPETKKAANQASVIVPFEGMAITNEPTIAEMVRSHFGKNSIVPKSVHDFPTAFERLIERHFAHLKPKE